MGAGEPRFDVLGPLLIEVDARPVSPPGSVVVRGADHAAPRYADGPALPLTPCR